MLKVIWSLKGLLQWVLPGSARPCICFCMSHPEVLEWSHQVEAKASTSRAPRRTLGPQLKYLLVTLQTLSCVPACSGDRQPEQLISPGNVYISGKICPACMGLVVGVEGEGGGCPSLLQAAVGVSISMEWTQDWKIVGHGFKSHLPASEAERPGRGTVTGLPFACLQTRMVLIALASSDWESGPQRHRVTTWGTLPSSRPAIAVE